MVCKMSVRKGLSSLPFTHTIKWIAADMALPAHQLIIFDILTIAGSIEKEGWKYEKDSFTTKLTYEVNEMGNPLTPC